MWLQVLNAEEAILAGEEYLKQYSLSRTLRWTENSTKYKYLFRIKLLTIYLEDDKERRLAAKTMLRMFCLRSFYTGSEEFPSRDYCVQGCLFQGFFCASYCFQERKEHYVLWQKQRTYRTKSINRRGRYNAGAFWLLGDVPCRVIQC
jgi:hypothetical protein